MTSNPRQSETPTKHQPVSPSKKRHLPTLDGWRSIALALVLLCHTTAGFYDRDAYFATSVPRYGEFALDVFFALSGLLICKLFFEEFDKTGFINLPSFYVRRMCRISMPCAVFTAIVAALGLLKSKWELASCLLFFRNFLPASLGGHYTAHLWSLAIEEHFYLLLPGLLLLPGIRRAPLLLVMSALLCEAWRAIDLHFHLLSRLLPEVPPGARTDLRLDAFLWGCVGACLIHNPVSAEWLKTWFKAWIWLGVLALCVFCLEKQPRLVATWTAILIPLLLLGPLLHPTWLASRLLNLLPLRYIGRISYSFYLWQQVLLIPKWEPSVPQLRYLQTFPMNLLAIAGTSLLSFYLVEKPLTRLGQKLSKRITVSVQNESVIREEVLFLKEIDSDLPVANATHD